MKELLKKVAIAGAGSLLIGGFAFAAIGNDHTGFDSENKASVEVRNDADVSVHNDTNLHNSVNGDAKTGDNESSKNTGDGMVQSGDASSSINVTNNANDSKLAMATDDDDMGLDLSSVTNSTTGANSDNSAWVKLDNSLKVKTTNDADVNNCTTLKGDTGNNKSSYNTGDGSVSTGDVSLNVTYDSTLNTSDVSIH